MENTEPKKKMDWNEKYGKKNKKKMGKKGVIIIVAIILVVLGLATYGFFKVKGAYNQAMDSLGDGTIVEEYGKKDMSTYIDVTGEVESQNVENITTTLQYPVKEIRVKVGDHVKKGDVVCVIDSSDIDDQISDLEAQASDEDKLNAKEIESASHTLSTTAATNERTLDDANVSVSEAKKAFDDADADYYEKLDAYNNAVNSGASEEEIAEKKAALDTANSTWYEKQYAYDQATSAYNDTVEKNSETYQSAKDTADITYISNTKSYSATATSLAKYYKMKAKTEIIAETSGVVTSISAVEGVVPSGAIMTIEDDKNLELNVGIKEKDYFAVKEGMSVELTNSSLDNVKGSGKVASINNFSSADTTSVAAAAGATQGAVADNTFKAKITITDFTDMLIGMKVKARIDTGEEMTTEAVPYTAIISDAYGDYVYVAEPAGSGMYTVAKKEVTKGMSGDYYTQVESDELEEGDLVIAYPSTVKENDIITINEGDKDSDTGKNETKDESKDDKKDEKKDKE